jgi:hypothetical protein
MIGRSYPKRPAKVQPDFIRASNHPKATEDSLGSSRLLPDRLLAQPVCRLLVFIRFLKGRAYLKMLTENVSIHATKATIKIPHKASTLLHIMKLYPFSPSLQLPFSSVRAANAKDKFADSKMMKNKSKRTSRIFALGDRRPKGLPVYSSQVI